MKRVTLLLLVFFLQIETGFARQEVRLGQLLSESVRPTTIKSPSYWKEARQVLRAALHSPEGLSSQERERLVEVASDYFSRNQTELNALFDSFDEDRRGSVSQVLVLSTLALAGQKGLSNGVGLSKKQLHDLNRVASFVSLEIGADPRLKVHRELFFQALDSIVLQAGPLEDRQDAEKLALLLCEKPIIEVVQVLLNLKIRRFPNPDCKNGKTTDQRIFDILVQHFYEGDLLSEKEFRSGFGVLFLNADLSFLLPYALDLLTSGSCPFALKRMILLGMGDAHFIRRQEFSSAQEKEFSLMIFPFGKEAIDDPKSPFAAEIRQLFQNTFHLCEEALT